MALKNNLFFKNSLREYTPLTLLCYTYNIFNKCYICKTKKKITLLYFIATLKNSRISANAAYLDCEVTAFGLCYCSQVRV